VRVRVKMFGVLAERAGRREDVFDLPGSVTGADVLRAVGERYPGAAGLLDRISVVVNREAAGAEEPLAGDDEVALLPPVAGGAPILVGLRDRPSIEEAVAAVAAPGAGGTAVFLGTVRDHADAGPVERLEFSAYEEMAEGVMRRIAEEATQKWGLAGAAVLHAVGSLRVGEPTVVVACAAAHRDEALEACRHVIDEVKRRLPVWKKEHGPWGSRWVNAE